MKTKIFWIAILAMLSLTKYSSYAQGTIITTPGQHVVTYGEIPNLPTTKIVAEKVNPSQVQIGFGWPANFWATPVGNPDDGSRANFVNTSLPGPYQNIGTGGSMGTIVSYVSDPLVKADGTINPSSLHLSDFNGIITAENLVELELSNVFSNPSYSKGLIKMENGQENVISTGQLVYQIASSGNYRLRTRSGSGSPREDVDFSVVITGSTTPTVNSVTISPSSASVNQGAGQQFTATVTGTNNPGQEVVWTVDGNASASTTISSAGYLSVATNETATLLTVRATSAVDPTKSGTASVSVNIVIPTYALTVIGGVGGGLYPAFTEIDVTANPPATGKRFKNWTSSGGGTFANANAASTTFTMPGNAVTVTANYENIVYPITYNFNGGTGTATPAAYTVESGTVTLPVPSKAGNTFAGWFDNADFAGSPVTAIPAGSTGDKEFWAKWDAILSDYNPEAVQIILFPNPVNDILYIKGITQGVKIEVTDLSGRNAGLQLTSPQSSVIKIDVSALPQGIYLVKSGGFVGKFVKQ